MTASVIALSVQNGSAGYAIAHRVADKLKYSYYDWEITAQAADLAGVPPGRILAAERVPGFIERMMQRLGAVSSMTIEGSPSFSDPSPAIWDSALQSLTSQEYREVIERVVEQLAERGRAVIVGHAAQYILRDTPSVLKVFVHGSLSVRAQRFATEQSISVEAAQPALKQSDNDRRNLMRNIYRVDWTDASLYDLTLSTDLIPEDQAVETIFAAARQMT